VNLGTSLLVFCMSVDMPLSDLLLALCSLTLFCPWYKWKPPCQRFPCDGEVRCKTTERRVGFLLEFRLHILPTEDPKCQLRTGRGRAGRREAWPRPAPANVPTQLFDDRPAAAELVMPLKGRRVGVYWKLFEDASPEVVRVCKNALSLLEEHGCEVTPCHLTGSALCMQSNLSSPACISQVCSLAFLHQSRIVLSECLVHPADASSLHHMPSLVSTASLCKSYRPWQRFFHPCILSGCALQRTSRDQSIAQMLETYSP
jgi:hypothetical protein